MHIHSHVSNGSQGRFAKIELLLVGALALHQNKSKNKIKIKTN